MDTVTKLNSGGDNSEPQRIGSFVVIGKLGEGGMGAVYKAQDCTLDRTIALKLLPPHLAADEAFITRFKREAAAAAKFSHPNLVQVYAAGEDAGTHFIAMEFIEGESLQKRIRRDGRLACDDALAVAINAAKGLSYAWNKAQLVHRDIKPDNILISHDGDVKVADLGLAKTLQGGSTNFTQTGTVMGSPHYISPEQGRGDKDVDFRSDIYSLGCTLYHMLTGRPPFEGDNLGVLIHKHIYEPAPEIATLRPDCPANVAALVKKMMAKDRAKRFATYNELIAELTAAHSALGKSETVGAAAKKRKMMMLAGVGVAVVSVVAGVLLWQPWKSAGVVAPVPGRVSATPSTPSLLPAAGTAATTPTPTDDFIREVAALPAEEQVKRVVAKLKELNPGFNPVEVKESYSGVEGEKVYYRSMDGRVVTEFHFASINVTNISPVCALKGLEMLRFSGFHVPGKTKRVMPFHDLNQLKGLKLRHLACDNTSVVDLSPLSEMPLLYLSFMGTKVSDLTPISMLNLESCECGYTKVRDLAALRNMPLKKLSCPPEAANDPYNRTVLRSLKTLQTINDLSVAEFWKQVDAGKLPGASAETTASVQPVDDAFIKEVAALPAEEQVKRVVAKLKELNPEFDGKFTRTIEDAVVTELQFSTVGVTDISPVRALLALKQLECEGERTAVGWEKRKGSLSDLSPLQGMKLTELRCGVNKIEDLSPLKGMSLTSLRCFYTYVADLTPLSGMPLRKLRIGKNNINDLSPLKGMQLEEFVCNERRVTDLSPLVGMPLKGLFSVSDTSVRDLSPLQGTQLERLNVVNSFVTDLSPISNCPLRTIDLNLEVFNSKNVDLLRSMKTLELINKTPVKEFWQRFDAGETPKPK